MKRLFNLVFMIPIVKSMLTFDILRVFVTGSAEMIPIPFAMIFSKLRKIDK